MPPTSIVSFPKSGVTWLRFLLVNVMQEEFGLQSYGLSADLNNFCKSDPRLPQVTWSHDRSHILTERGDHRELHALFHLRDRGGYSDKRVILLVRDPRDVAVSHFHQVTKRSDQPIHFPDVDAFVRDPICGLDRVIAFMNLWAAERNTPKEMLMVRYEELILATEHTLARICRFIGLTPSPESLEKAIRLGDADNMRNLEKDGKIADFRSFGSDPNTLKVRKARIGSWRTELSAETAAYCEQRMATLHPLYGYTPEAVVAWEMAEPSRKHSELLRKQNQILKTGVESQAELLRKISELETRFIAQQDSRKNLQTGLTQVSAELAALSQNPLSAFKRRELTAITQKLLKLAGSV